MIILRTICYASLFGGMLFVLVPWLIATRLPAAPEVLGAWRWLGFIPLGLGIAVAVWCAAMFSTAGQGTTAPFDPPRRLVARGLYRYSRNPMYVAGLAMLAGEALLWGSLPMLVYAAVLGITAHVYVVYWEEPALLGRFGQAYADYTASTPRWFSWPGRRRDESSS